MFCFSVTLSTKNPDQNLCLLCLQYVFVSFLSRDNTYKILMSVCLHLEVGHESHWHGGQTVQWWLSQRNQVITILETLLLAQEKSPCGSPAPSPAEHSFRGQRSPLSPRLPMVGQTHGGSIVCRNTCIEYHQHYCAVYMKLYVMKAWRK